MRKTGYLYDDRYRLHDTGSYHPETDQRLKAIHTGITEAGLLERLCVFPAEPPERRWIETVHESRYVERFKSACRSQNASFDSPDNPICADTFETAMLAAGGAIEAARRVMSGTLDNAFCALRPPGHHAESNRAMGFCYFNNAAIVSRYLQSAWHVGRVGIVDFDVHHGNGTQHLFEEDPSVFYYSIHQHPSFAYPGTGREFEKGKGAGYGFTLNVTVLPGQGDEAYMALMEKTLLPAFKDFKPEVIVVSTGFDAHSDDDMSDINLSTAGFFWIMEKIAEMADAYSDGRLISILEGGYSLRRLPELARDHITILLG